MFIVKNNLFKGLLFVAVAAVVVGSILAANYFVMAWVAPSQHPPGGSPTMVSPWSDSAGNVYYDSGYVGIGTPSPGEQLTITGCLRFDNAGTGDVDVDFCNDDASYNNDGVALRTMTNPASGEPIFRVLSSGGSERLRVEYDGALKTTNVLEVDGTGDSYVQGNMGIGTVGPQHKLDVEGSAEFGIGTSNLELVQNGLVFEIRHHDPGVAWRDIALNPYGGNVGIGTNAPGEKLDVNGNVRATSFLYSSDEKLKKDIQPIDKALDKILKLDGVSFAWKDNKELSVGLIAQDLEQVFPELVRTNPQTGLKSVQYGNLVAPLIEAIKEQQKQIEEMKSEIEKLKKEEK